MTAQTLRIHFEDLNMQRGVLIGLPVPQQDPSHAQKIEDRTREALELAKANGVTGKYITPFVLKSIAKLMNSSSLTENSR